MCRENISQLCPEFRSGQLLTSGNTRRKQAPAPLPVVLLQARSTVDVVRVVWAVGELLGMVVLGF